MYPTCANARSFRHTITRLMLAILASVWLPACAQTPEQPPQGAAYEPVFSAEEIAELVAPIALYPDDLLAIVLPASTYPLQIVEAQRFLDQVKNDPSRKPPDDWDDSVVALLNYPEVVKLMSDDLDWTQNLGEAVLAQQPEVLAAIEGFRKRAYTSGNLRSDDRQVVEVQDDTIRIRPADPQIIYVPYYEPAAVTVYRTVPAYYYYPRPYPVYYYPYPADYVFMSGFFWGVTTFYTLGWHTHHIHTYYYDYDYHPYYGRPYYHHRHYYRRPPPPRVGHDYRVNDGSWERHEYPHDSDRQYYDRNGDRTLDGYTAKPRDAYQTAPQTTTAARDSAETYWRPDYRRTGARPGTDPRIARYQRGAPRQQRVVQTTPEAADASGNQPPPSTQPVPAEPVRRQGEPRGSWTREQYRQSTGEPQANGAGNQPQSNGPTMQRGQPREGSLQQRMEAQRRGAPVSAQSPERGQQTPAPAQDQELRRLERQEQEQARRQIEQQERSQRQFEQQQRREQSDQRYGQVQRQQNGRQYEQRQQAETELERRDRAEAQRQYEQQRRDQARARSELEQRERTQRQFEQQERQQAERQNEQQRYRQEQSERAQRQYEQQREQEQRRYQPDSRQQEQQRYEQESRHRSQQQLAPQSWQQRQSVPQPQGGNDVRMQPRTVDAPRNYRNEMNAQRVERAAPQPERRQVETRRTPRPEQGGERSDGNARSGDAGRESGSRSMGREANGNWMRY